VNDPGPLRGPDVRPQLRHAESFGVTTGQAADGVPTIEFTTDPAVHGPTGRVDVQCAASGGRGLTAAVRFGDRGRATCQSRDSIRVWGRFAPDVEVVVGAPGAVRLVARTPAGAVLAGPVMVRPDGSPTALAW
jgi:hypothetical protein